MGVPEFRQNSKILGKERGLMLQEARDLQNNAVGSLVNIVLKENKPEFTFKAPTGSGKTYMMADFMNRILSTKI